VSIKRIPLCLNAEDPEQKELLDFVTTLPNGKKRNASAFLRILVDREYQKRKEQYLAEKEKETQKAPRVEVVKRDIKYLAKEVNQDSNSGTNSSTN
jgi:hypothetical protein